MLSVSVDVGPCKMFLSHHEATTLLGELTMKRKSELRNLIVNRIRVNRWEIWFNGNVFSINDNQAAGVVTSLRAMIRVNAAARVLALAS